MGGWRRWVPSQTSKQKTSPVYFPETLLPTIHLNVHTRDSGFGVLIHYYTFGVRLTTSGEGDDRRVVGPSIWKWEIHPLSYWKEDLGLTGSPFLISMTIITKGLFTDKWLRVSTVHGMCVSCKESWKLGGVNLYSPVVPHGCRLFSFEDYIL